MFRYLWHCRDFDVLVIAKRTKHWLFEWGARELQAVAQVDVGQLRDRGAKSQALSQAEREATSTLGRVHPNLGSMIRGGWWAVRGE